MEEFKCLNGVVMVHNAKDCKGDYCVIHRPSSHNMATWPIYIRFDRGCLAERICKHGIGHPDPDSLAFLKELGSQDEGVHGCDGCESKGTNNEIQTGARKVARRLLNRRVAGRRRVKK